MSVSARPLFSFDDSFVRELEGLYLPWQAAPASAPRLLALNASLARELGADPVALATDAGIGLLTGTAVPAETTPVAQAYAGHQFGGYSPRLGDGRALLIGELVDADGRRRDLHLKGSGRTPFARGGDGRAAVGPMLREYLVSEAMHALGIPTTRALAVVATGDTVVRETPLPGAVLARVAASHLRVGTFQYAAATGDEALLRRLADYAIARHHPHAAAAENPYRALLEAVVEVQAALIARWMLVGFVHGVMNTDNMTISGETIDYGPCAFLDGLDRATVFSSIDHGGRYAYGNQPQIALWNLTRLAETLLRLLADEPEPAREAATAVLSGFGARYHAHFERGLRAKVGLPAEGALDDEALGEDLIVLMEQQRVDFSAFFRALSAAARGDAEPARAQFPDAAPLDAWLVRWQAQLGWSGRDPHAAAAAMDRVNPVCIPRNHLVEEALDAATAGELEPFERLLGAVTRPFDAQPGLERYAAPAPPGFSDSFQTFCGT
ncbi:YdiU family protein [Conexibacter sp. JD483]|uniref:protein adenylyltransferase SelO n=1 Tax=unclassified Conexibacter TaxID=2627773 RepID=UPI00271887BF|nr:MULTISPECIES: YdiU family protein [unclassified Conexibacter]MDO8188336.1 YdiU family protein [Conexibacter sp. CPCC 205706]MDO8200716.1 YdiU family protein [Conexibacter sp. CPCC 205762]MDR9369440.1 YdiU family protein [Conexibacter sp. JD483]